MHGCRYLTNKHDLCSAIGSDVDDIVYHDGMVIPALGSRAVTAQVYGRVSKAGSVIVLSARQRQFGLAFTVHGRDRLTETEPLGLLYALLRETGCRL